jgi:peptide alpha-N-acetyltransferase
LVSLQPTNWNYYHLWFETHSLTERPEKEEDRNKLLQLITKVPGNNLLRGRLLPVYAIDDFQGRFEEFVRPYFEKSQPSLFREMVHLYSDKERVAIIQKVATTHLFIIN